LNCTYSTPAYYNGTVYVGMTSSTLAAYTLSGGLFNQSGGVALPSSTSVEVYQYPGPTPSISASPVGNGNGIVWVLDTSANGTASDSAQAPFGPAILRAYDAGNLQKTLYSSSTLASDAAGNAVKFTEPTIANGKVYVGGASSLTVYGLLH
jgi:outer membrane protein assembly factor BamB